MPERFRDEFFMIKRYTNLYTSATVMPPTPNGAATRLYDNLIDHVCRHRYNNYCISNKSSAVAEIGDRLATIDMGRKLGSVPLFFLGGWRGSWAPSNTIWSGPRPIFVPSGILIHQPLGVELGSHLTQCCLGRGLPPYQVVS